MTSTKYLRVNLSDRNIPTSFTVYRLKRSGLSHRMKHVVPCSTIIVPLGSTPTICVISSTHIPVSKGKRAANSDIAFVANEQSGDGMATSPGRVPGFYCLRIFAIHTWLWTSLDSVDWIQHHKGEVHHSCKLCQWTSKNLTQMKIEIATFPCFQKLVGKEYVCAKISSKYMPCFSRQ